MNAFRLFVCAVIYMITVIMGGEVKAQTTFWWPAPTGTLLRNCPYNCLTCASRTRYHAGIDIVPMKGARDCVVTASSVGVVHAIIPDGPNAHGLGNCVIMRHAVVISSRGNTANYYTLYGHLASFTPGLRTGLVVQRGQNLGIMGKTGEANGVIHLHFEVKTAGVTGSPYGGQYWGYTPSHPNNYGFIDPYAVMGSWQAVPISR